MSQHMSPWRAQMLAWREITGLCRHGEGNPAWRGNYRSLSPWRAKSRLAGKLQVSVAMASKISPGGEITGMSPWRAKSHLACDEQFVAMAGYVLPGGTVSEQVTSLRTFPPQILFFTILDPKFD